MQSHLELLKVEPLFGLLRVQIVEVVAGGEAEGVELSFRGEQQRCWCFLVDDSWISTLPLAHHVDAVRIPRETESVSAKRGTKVNGHNHEMSGMSSGGIRAGARVY